jgi:hypothetical protein
MPLLNLTLAIFLSPELGFLGFVMPTRRHTPFIAGLCTSCGDTFLRAFCPTRQPFRTWLNVALGDGVAMKVLRCATPLNCADGSIDAGFCGLIDGSGIRINRRRNVRGILMVGADVQAMASSASFGTGTCRGTSVPDALARWHVRSGWDRSTAHHRPAKNIRKIHNSER